MASEALTRVFVTPNHADAERDRIQFVELGGVRVGIRTRFVSFDQRWRLWVLDLDGSRIFGPVTMVPGIDLLREGKHDPRVPQGQLFIYSADREPPDAASMDAPAVLYYRNTE